ncbi:polysaccharide deacetylase family protein [Chitinilyticum piscinae]|uniref:Polysaccharide deacetylase family protein n=1 Tax=Chitinilyticum piscinae TaxID=2866724 RepID=A0A8J7FLM0_9NEIS|nr:polysaccharide deacetylase family protein [Chitinilyticum piscinae]MBE9608566.1 polysaccharide deacetylase family protein [Chitinilyticum piscinae]
MPAKNRTPGRALLLGGLLLLLLAWISWEWWPRQPPTASGVVATTAKGAPRVYTPYLPNWDQVEQARMEQQGAHFPGQVWLEGPTHRRLIALTFDDGPSEYTSSLLDVLDKHHARATFFWLGQNLDGRKEIAQRALRAGHTLGNHTWSHPDMVDTAESYWWDEELARTQVVYQRMLGIEPLLMRPPYGRISDAQITRLQARGMKVILWSLDTQDWNRNRMLFGAHAIERGLQDYVHEEAIVLMHDGGGKRGKTVEAVDALIPWLRAGGYELVTVDELLGVPAYRAAGQSGR